MEPSEFETSTRKDLHVPEEAKISIWRTRKTTQINGVETGPLPSMTVIESLHVISSLKRSKFLTRCHGRNHHEATVFKVVVGQLKVEREQLHKALYQIKIVFGSLRGILIANSEAGR